MSPGAKIWGREPLGPHKVGACGHELAIMIIIPSILLYMLPRESALDLQLLNMFYKLSFK